MTDWQSYLKPDEVEQLASIPARKAELIKLRKTLRDRANMRAKRAKEKAE